MEPGRIAFGLVALGVMALMLTGKGSYFNPGKHVPALYAPSASFWGGGVPGTMPTGEPTWLADPYQVDTSGQFIRAYPTTNAWRDKKARTRVTSQKMIGAKI